MKMEVTEVVTTLVEQMLPRGSGQNKILQVILRVTATAVSGEERNRLAIFLFHRPGNYTKVIFKTTLDTRARPENFTDWEMVSNHDSAWRSDGVEHTLSMIESEMRRELSHSKGCEVAASFAFCQPRVVNVQSALQGAGRKFLIEW